MKWPQGWRETSLLQVCELNPRLTAEEKPAGDTPVSFVPMSAVDESIGAIIEPETRSFAEVQKGYTPFREGDLLFAKVTPCMENGKAALARDLVNGFGFGSTEFHVLRPMPNVLLAEFLFHFVRQSWFRAQAAAAFVGTGGLQRVPPEFFKRVRLPLPPLPEQQRIVEMLREADALVQDKSSAAQRFDKLVQARYRQQFGPYFASDGLRSPVRIGEYLESAQYGISEAMGESGSHAVLRMNSITTSGWWNLRDLKYADVSTRDAKATELRDGDVLFNRTNSKELVGKCAIWRDAAGRFSFASYLVRLRLKKGLWPEFLWATLNSPYGKYRLFNAAKQAVSMANVSPTDLARITIPLPSPEEQQAFADFVRDIEAQRKQLIETVESFDKLMPALVAQALSGRLTAAWREQHRAELDAAIRARDEALGAPTRSEAVQPTVRAPPERSTGFARPRRQALIDQLSAFQREVLSTLRHEWRSAVLVDDPAVFDDFCTSPRTAWRLEGFAAGRDEVRRALEQLAAMGLVRKMSLPHDNRSTLRTEFLTAFRPLRGDETGSRAEEDTALQDAEQVVEKLKRREQEGR
ncbi:restriction endonuclease subunit S [Pyxidicoccus xibeiensis]|uniref:restriction endonuclease subunit S n=1 Tax=Pyxidicoccus xibeiensis TaxID=2906759 RepID=UPI0020A77E1F|nr:restriction endonuclease subunit S [Pyxidicoccus xibeiensis]MCP3142103.1 restriction endonuclease subunit S [Pyxidicoccus xibeiensis]